MYFIIIIIIVLLNIGGQTRNICGGEDVSGVDAKNVGSVVILWSIPICGQRSHDS
jgi:hypothetical protein